MFKLGDKVRAIRSVQDITEGEVYTVAGFTNDNPHVIDDVGDSRCVNGWGIPLFELVVESPIRTVTRREIVPGRYGRVRVSELDSDGDVHMVFVDREGGDKLSEGCSFYFNLEELDEVIHTLNQIREVMVDA
jgi:hypothetical protein